MEVTLDGGHRLNVEVDGPDDGPPVLFLHGVQSNAETYGWLPAAVTDGRRVLRLDHRGHGRSAQPGSYALDDYYADVVAVLERVAGRPAVVVGQSLGGVLAWRLAQQRPDLLHAAFAEDPPLFMSVPEVFAASAIPAMIADLERMVAGWKAERLDEAAVLRRYASSPVAPGASEIQTDLFHDDAIAAQARAFLQLDPGVQVTARDNRMLVGLDVDGPIQVPMLILAADEACGGVFRAVDAERLATTHPEVDVVALEGATHRIHSQRQHRAEYTRLLARFLDEHAR